MIDKSSNIKGVIGKAALIAAAGAGYFSLESRNNTMQQSLVSNQVKYTKNIKDMESSFGAELKKERADRAKLEGDFAKYKEDMSKQAIQLTTNFEALQGSMQTSKTELEQYSSMIQSVKDLAESAKSEAGGLADKIGGLEKGQETANARMDNIKSEEQTRMEIYNKRVPSVVQIFFTRLTKSGPETGSLTGSIIKDKKGEYKILTASHGIQNRVPEADVTIILHSSHGTQNGGLLNFKIPHEDSSLIHCLGAPGRDVSVIDIPKDSEGEELLRKLKIEGIPLAPIEEPKVSSAIYGIGKNWSPYPPSTLSAIKREWHGWKFEKTMLVTRGASVKPGDSGGPLLDRHGRLIGIAQAMEQVVTTVPIIADKKIVGSISVNTAGASTSEAYFVSIPDIHRSFLNIGIDMAGSDRNHLVKRDILNNRPYAAMPPLLGPSFANILTSIPVIDMFHWEPYLLKSK